MNDNSCGSIQSLFQLGSLVNHSKKVSLNLTTGIINKVFVIAFGFVVQKMLLDTYGSEVTGLFSTIVSIYTYLALIEAGIGASALQDLYKPAAANDTTKINEILCATRSMYRKYALPYAICMVVAAIAFPFIVPSSFDTGIVIALGLLQGATSLANYWFVAGMNQLLTAEGKTYVGNMVALATTVASNVLKIILILSVSNILFLQVAYFLVSFGSVAFYMIYFRKAYPWVSRNQKAGTYSLKQRGSFLAHQVGGVVFNNTDILLISAFCGLKEASVYAIYSLVFKAVNQFAYSITSSPQYLLGQTYAKGISGFFTAFLFLQNSGLHRLFCRHLCLLCSYNALFVVVYGRRYRHCIYRRLASPAILPGESFAVCQRCRIERYQHFISRKANPQSYGCRNIHKHCSKRHSFAVLWHLRSFAGNGYCPYVPHKRLHSLRYQENPSNLLFQELQNPRT